MTGAKTVRGRSGIIHADKRGWQRMAMHRLVIGKVRGAFRSVLVQGMEQLRESIAADPRGLLLLANHSSWWDAFLCHVLSESIPLDGYLMLIHFNMIRFRMLRRIGAFSIDPGSPSRVRESMVYAAELMKRPTAGVWMCPQGEIRSNDLRPLEFQRGLRLLLDRAGTLRVVPVALRYEFWQDERPHVFARFGPARDYEARDRATFVEACETLVTQELDRLKQDVDSQDGGRFTRVLRGKGSMNDQYARLRARFFGKTPGAPDDY